MVTGLYKSGASIGSAVAFFLGNPTLNPAVLVFMVFTIGWPWAALRLVLGLVLVAWPLSSRQFIIRRSLPLPGSPRQRRACGGRQEE